MDAFYSDPSLVKFLKQKRKPNTESIAEETPTPEKRPKEVSLPELPTLDVLQSENSSKWLNFNVVESAKLEWMRDLPGNLPELKPGEQYEARFDWKGVLLPFSLQEENFSRELYLHGDDAHRPGYTLQELFRLAR